MKFLVRMIAVFAVAGVTAVSAAMASTATNLPAASRYYPFVGHWKGHGQLSEPGQKPTPLTLSMSCSKASSGWAVRCEMLAKNGKMKITESDLMGVDPVTGTGHWYAVTNEGETHDHVTEWPDPKTMKAHHTWTQDGKKMEEDISFQFTGKKSVEFRSAVTQDGQPAGEFSGKLTR